MPTISRFYGIIITMYFKEHGVPHFHARYGKPGKRGGYEAVYSVNSLRRIAGWLPTPQQKVVEAWAVIHHAELLENAARWQRGLPLQQIAGIR